jgi:hypothetical protein
MTNRVPEGKYFCNKLDVTDCCASLKTPRAKIMRANPCFPRDTVPMFASRDVSRSFYSKPFWTDDNVGNYGPIPSPYVDTGSCYQSTPASERSFLRPYDQGMGEELPPMQQTPGTYAAVTPHGSPSDDNSGEPLPANSRSRVPVFKEIATI